MFIVILLYILSLLKHKYGISEGSSMPFFDKNNVLPLQRPAFL